MPANRVIVTLAIKESRHARLLSAKGSMCFLAKRDMYFPDIRKKNFNYIQ